MGDGESDVSTVVAIYGANASGKSNVIAAINFARTAVVSSHSEWKVDDGIRGYTPFLLTTERNDPSRFEFELLLDGMRVQYGFECDKRKFTKEWLYRYPVGRRQVLFERHDSGDRPVSWHFGRHLSGPNRAVAETTRLNSLFLSAAATAGHDRLTPVYRWFSFNLVMVPAGSRATRLSYSLARLEADEAEARRLLNLIRVADLGIVDAKIGHIEFSESDIQRFTRLFEVVTEGVESAPEVDDDWIRSLISEGSRYVEFEHVGDGGVRVTLPFDAESDGTKALVSLSAPVLTALQDADTLIVDELDTSLHSLLVWEIVGIFKSRELNPNRAQLIFSTHDTSLLGGLLDEQMVLDRDQVWLTEKDQIGATRLYPLTDFSPRRRGNLERGYLQGRYGAVPMLGELTWSEEPSESRPN